MGSKKRLDYRQELFVAAYLKNGGNAAKAVIAAGYSPKHANKSGFRLMSNPLVKAKIQKRVEKALITAEEVITELKTVGLGKYETYKSDKIKSLELLGKHLKIFTEKSEISIDLTQLTDDQLDALANGKG